MRNKFKLIVAAAVFVAITATVMPWPPPDFAAQALAPIMRVIKGSGAAKVGDPIWDHGFFVEPKTNATYQDYVLKHGEEVIEIRGTDEDKIGLYLRSGSGTSSRSAGFQIIPRSSDDYSSAERLVIAYDEDTDEYVFASGANGSGAIHDIVFRMLNDKSKDLFLQKTTGYVGVNTKSPKARFSVDGPIHLFGQASSPSAPTSGTIFFDLSGPDLKWYNGTGWTSITGSGGTGWVLPGDLDPEVPADGTKNVTGNIQASGTVTGSNLSGTNTGDQSGANPSATVNGSAVNGSAATFMRSDAAPALADPFTPADGTQNITGNIAASGMASATSITLTENTGLSSDRWIKTPSAGNYWAQNGFLLATTVQCPNVYATVSQHSPLFRPYNTNEDLKFRLKNDAYSFDFKNTAGASIANLSATGNLQLDGTLDVDGTSTSTVEGSLTIGNTMGMSGGNLHLVGGVSIGTVLQLPRVSTAPASPTRGTVYFDIDDDTAYCWDGTTWQALW